MISIRLKHIDPSKFLQSSLPSNVFMRNIIDNDRLSMLADQRSSLDSELQIVLDQQDIIAQTMTQLFPSRVTSTSDSQLEYELANLIYGHPEHDYRETTLVVHSNKSS
jgi:hypothetical protein